MGLIERLRKAEEQGKQASRDAIERARELGEDVERRIRQKMRVYPPQANHTNHTEAGPVTPSGAATAPRRSPVPVVESENPEDEPIVSIHGEDLETGKVA